ncbi:hypothetical protein ABGB07_40455 [Micromonosporaceae bacterium B7E4]
MFGTAGFVWPAGFFLLGPAAVCVASTRSQVSPDQPNRLAVLSIQPGRLAVLSIQPGRLDSGARG